MPSSSIPSSIYGATSPTIVFITQGKVHEVNLLGQVPIEAGGLYILVRAYGDFARLYRVHQSSAFFVTKTKANFRFERLYSRPVDKSEGVQCDQIIVLHHFYVKRDYPEKLRRIRFYDREQNRRLVFLTNNFTLPALTIAKIYKCRWQIELFFQWIKQHLRIEAFYGAPENAVKTQIWIVISVAEPLHNSTDSECHPFRENADPAGPFGHRLQRSRGAVS